MFTESVDEKDANVLSQLLGIRLLSTDVLYQTTDRKAYFAPALACQNHLFLDPDTGFRLQATAGRVCPSYLFGNEAIELVSKRPKSLTLVFDQSLARGQEREQLARKMTFLEENGILSFAYVSHACFILMAKDRGLFGRAWEVVQEKSRLPETRFLR